MVFSFFKKEPEKMVAKAAAVPRAKGGSDGALFGGKSFDKSASQPASQNLPSPAAQSGSSTTSQPFPAGVATQPFTASQSAATVDNSSLDFSAFEFSECLPNFQVEVDLDPVDAEAEDAAVLYANGSDDTVRSVLENAVRIHHFGPGERLWLMLFDLYRLNGLKASFEALGIDYAQAFEKSPPAWTDKSRGKSQTKELVAGNMLFKGALTGENKAAFEAIRTALDKNPKLRLDLSKVVQLDAAGCGCLLDVLQKARKAKRTLELLGRDTLGALVEKCVESGKPENSECWLLLLELCQLQGQQEAFDEVAINYAITFEVSPPSWESGRVAAPEPVLQAPLIGDDDDVAVDAYAIRGDVKAARFADLPAHAEVHDPVLIDCSGLTRIDFISAGALVNVLTVIQRSGKKIALRHPNHLVAELFGIVGMKSVATIVFAKH